MSVKPRYTLNVVAVLNRRQFIRTYASPSITTPVPKSGFNNQSKTEFAQILNGCWQLAGGHGTELFDNIQNTFQTQYDAGFTTFDTADIYGPSEGILGEFVSQCKNDGKPQPQIFTKYVPNIFRGVPDSQQVKLAIEKSCSAIGMDCLDLVQLHWWDYGVSGMVDTGMRLMELKEQGMIRNLGVTNLNVEAVQQLLDAGVEVVSNQVQFSLIDRRPLNGMLQLCEKHNIKLFAYGSIAGGLLSDKHVEKPRSGLFGKVKYSNLVLNTSSLKMYWNVINQFGGQDLWRKLLLVLQEIGSNKNCSVANVALAWTMAQSKEGIVHPVIGLRKSVHIEDNLRVLGLKLSQNEQEQIQEILEESSGPQGDIYSFERAG